MAAPFRRLLPAAALLLLVPAAGAAPPARLDAYGDPLPAGALARLGTTRLRSGHSIIAVALAPDAKTVAVSGQADGVRLLDAASGKLLRRVGPKEAGATALAFSPDGKLLAAVEGAENVQLYDAATGTAGHKLTVAQQQFNGVVFSADGKYVTATSDNGVAVRGAVPVWEVASGKLAATLPGLHNTQQRTAFSADGKLLALCGQFQAQPGDTEVPEEAMRTIQLWDVAKGKELKRLKGERMGDVFTNVAFAPDGKTLAATMGTSTITFWDVNTGKEVRRCLARRGTGPSLAYSPDGKYLAAGSDDGAMQLWDAATGKRLALYEGAPGTMPRARFPAGGKPIAYGNTDKAVYLYDLLAKKSLTPTEGHTDAVQGLAFGAGGKEVVTASPDGLVCTWDGAGKELRRVTVRDDIGGIGVLTEVVGGGALPGGVGPGGAPGVPVVLSPDGKHLLGSATGTLCDATTGKQVLAFDEAGAGDLLGAFSADGSHFAVADGAGGGGAAAPAPALRVYEVASGRQVRALTGYAGEVAAVAFSADGKLLAAATQPNPGAAPPELRAWNLTTGKERWQAKLAGMTAGPLAFSPDGKHLAAASEAGVVTLLDAATGRELRGFSTPKAESATALLFSPDGRLLAAAYTMTENKPPRVRVWEMASAAVRQEFAGHRGQVTALCFAPDGKRLATGATDTTALLWDLTGKVGEAPAKGKPAAEELDRLWAGLDGGADKALGAMRRLGDAPDEAVALLRKHVKPAQANAAEAKAVAQMIADLDADDFDAREKAAKGLEKLGKAAREPLKKALAAGPSAEVRRRLNELLEKLQDKGAPAPEFVRPLRAVEVLEGIATPEAKKLLEELAKGDADAPLTGAAKAALARLGPPAKER